MRSFLLFVLAIQLYAAVGTIVNIKERRNCQSAIYYYGVVSVELVCPPDLALPGTTKCKDSVLREVCRDPPEPQYIKCDPMVDIYRAADFYNSQITLETYRKETERYPVQWLLEPQADPAYYYKLRESALVQYVYKVNDSNVKPSQCATLMTMVSDRDDYTGLPHKWGQVRYTDHEELTAWYSTKLPLPEENGVRGGEWFIYSQLFLSRGTSAKINVNYMVRYEEVRIPTDHKNVKNTYVFNYRSEDANFKENGLNVLKEDLNIKPAEIATGDHTLVCYKIYKYPKKQILGKRPCSEMKQKKRKASYKLRAYVKKAGVSCIVVTRDLDNCHHKELTSADKFRAKYPEKTCFHELLKYICHGDCRWKVSVLLNSKHANSRLDPKSVSNTMTTDFMPSSSGSILNVNTENDLTVNLKLEDVSWPRTNFISDIAYTVPSSAVAGMSIGSTLELRTL